MNKVDYKKFLFAHRITTSKKPSESNKRKAFSIWEELARKDYLRSIFYLGVCYDTGFGVNKNPKKAFENYLLAAVSGHAEAQYNIYHMEFNGEGTKKNEKSAISWLKKAAIEGKNIDAIRDLGFFYHDGTYLKKNMKKAAEFYKKAAKQDDAIAQWNLGLCYRDGEGVRQSERWSRYWISKAAEQGHKLAIKSVRDKSK